MDSLDYMMASFLIWIVATKWSIDTVEAVSDEKWGSAVFNAIAVYGAARLGWLLWSAHHGA